MMVRMANEIPLLQYFKIEMPQTAAKLRGLIEAGGEAIIGPFDDEESITLIADLNAGAIGSMCSASLPEKIRKVVVDHSEGRNAEAASSPGNQNRIAGACKASRSCRDALGKMMFDVDYQKLFITPLAIFWVIFFLNWFRYLQLIS